MTEDESTVAASATSMHAQVEARLRALIAPLPSDARLPTESDLAATYGVSRTTIRRAVGALVEEGTLVRRQGAGTFVTPRPMVHALDQLRPFVSIFTSAGREPEGRILRFAWSDDAPAPRPTPEGATGPWRGLCFRRLYTIDGVPQAIGDITVPDPVGQRISRAQLEAHPIYRVLQEDMSITLSHGDITVGTVAASGDVATPLGIAAGDPLLTMSRVTYDTDERIVEYVTYYLLPDRFELRLSVRATETALAPYAFRDTGPELVMRYPGE